AIPAGIITDRVDRRALIIRMDILRAVAFVGAALAIWLALPLATAPAQGTSNTLLYNGILAAALLVGIAEVFRDNAAQTMLPSIVPHARLEKANGRLWSVEIIGNSLLGPAIGAFLIAVALPLPFIANALAYFAAILLLLRIKGRFKPDKETPKNWRAELAEGYNFLKNAPLLRTLALLTGGWNFVFHMMFIALVLHVQENLHLGAQAYGLILAAGAIGGVAGGWWAEPIKNALGSARTTQLALASAAPVFLAIAYAPGPISLAITIAVFEFTGLVWNTVSVSYRQRTIPDHLMGRVNSLYRLLAWGTMPLGLLFSGIIVRIAEVYYPRNIALTAPFIAAAIGAA
ncbi:MAG: MFS transporter, partial [Marinosulfonomonas sp.]|nr:MFS transporter [Marinosulfonomonas sp.]